MDSILAIDQDLVTDAVRTFALTTIEAYKNRVEMKWNEAELGIYLVYIFGEINKSEFLVAALEASFTFPLGGGKGRAAFCLAPAIPKEIPRDARKSIDYSEYPLTTHGELLFALVQSGMSAYPHQTVALQFFETVSRYNDFFKVRKQCIVPTLEAMIDSRYVNFLLQLLSSSTHTSYCSGIHHQNATFRSRVYYLFHRFIKESRNDIPLEFVPNISQSIRDLLHIEVEIPELDEVEVDFLTDAVKSSTFDAQLYLFETLGVLISLLFKTPSDQKALLLSFVKPLMDELSEALQASANLNLKELEGGAGGPDVSPVVKLHHLIIALGSIAKGFPDYPSPLPEGYILPPIDVFAEVAQAILVCLENTNSIKVVRDAVCELLRSIFLSHAHVLNRLVLLSRGS